MSAESGGSAAGGPGRSRRGLLVAVVMVAALGTGCDSFPASRGLGIGLRDGAPLILYLGCGDEKVTAVKVARPVGDSPWDGDDEILWSITVVDGEADQEEFLIGHTPRGFAEKELADIPSEADAELAVLVDSSHDLDVGTRFRLDELREDKILTALDELLLDEQDFRERAQERCS